MAGRKRSEATLSIGDRLLTAFLGFVVVFLMMCLVWLLTVRIWFAAMDTPLAFHWTWIVGLVFGAAGFVIGPERKQRARVTDIEREGHE